MTVSPAVTVRMAEYEPLLRPDPEVKEPNPIEYRGSTPLRAEITARLSPDTYILRPEILMAEVTFEGKVYPRVILLMLK